VGLPGQFLTVRLRERDGSAVLRSYSLSGPAQSGRWQVSVKRQEDGVGSRLLVDDTRIGDAVDIAAPRGGFLLAGGNDPVALVSAGIGVTPVLAMLHRLAATSDARPVWWLHGARNGREHPFAALARELLSRLGTAHARVLYSRPTGDDTLGEDFDAPGRVTADVIAEVGVPHDAHFYVCGPADFLSELQTGLVTLGVPSSHVHVERFGAAPAARPGVVAEPTRPPHMPDAAADVGPIVSFARSGITARFGGDSASLLEFAEACDVPVRWACRTGVCHSCETSLLAGDISYDPEPIDVPGGGVVLICCARPANDVVLDL
jgi:ferredoxin-NADP reductase